MIIVIIMVATKYVDMVPTNNTDDDDGAATAVFSIVRPFDDILQSATNDFVVKISSKSRFDIRGKN